MRYRTLDVRVWSDHKFRALSPLQASGQALFLYLLTNPNTNAIPGLYRAGAAGLAEELGWDLESFNQVFEEIKQQGLVKADFKSRLIFIPNAIKYNKPQSPNVVRSWSTHWDELPEGSLKDYACKIIKAFLEGLGEAFAQAFEEVICKSSRKPLPNQEQEQEQEKEIISSLPEDVASKTGSYSKTNDQHKTLLCPHEEIISLYHQVLPMCPQVKIWNKTRRSYLMRRWREDPRHQNIEWWQGYFEHVKQSKFLTGQITAHEGRQTFIADLEWLVRPNNFAKVIEGKYHNE